MTKAKAILSLVKPISEKKSLYTDIFDKKDQVSIDKKILNKYKAAKLPEIKLIILANKYITSV